MLKKRHVHNQKAWELLESSAKWFWQWNLDVNTLDEQRDADVFPTTFLSFQISDHTITTSAFTQASSW